MLRTILDEIVNQLRSRVVHLYHEAIHLAGKIIEKPHGRDRHNQTKSTLSSLLDQIEGVSNEEVASKILALQTSLQASLQTTSLIYKTNLTNYI